MSPAGHRLLFALVLGACAPSLACAPDARAPSSDDHAAPPSGLYRAEPVTLSDSCTPRIAAGTAGSSFFVTAVAGHHGVHANVPLTFDGLPWQELASRTTLDFDRTMTLVETPAPRCPGARRRRDIRVEASRGDDARAGFDLNVTETWSVPDDHDCELPDDAPHASCARVQRIALRVERACGSARELARLACDDPR